MRTGPRPSSSPQQGMKIRDIDPGAFREAAEALWQAQARELAVGTWLRAALR